MPTNSRCASASLQRQHNWNLLWVTSPLDGLVRKLGHPSEGGDLGARTRLGG